MIPQVGIVVIVLAMVVGIARAALPTTGPVTGWHYAPNANFAPAGAYRPGKFGFNLADVSSVQQLAFLPPGVRALVWIGRCDGVTTDFLRIMRSYLGQSRVFGFYLMDDPSPWRRLTMGGLQHGCRQSNLNAEADWIHVHMPWACSFVVVMNLGTPDRPHFDQGYDLATLKVDFIGVDPYPCRSERKGCDYDMINRYVAAVEATGVSTRRIVPVYQAFGGGHWSDGAGGVYSLPTPKEEMRIQARWGTLVPHPAFDYAYSWGSQRQSESLENSAPLQDVFAGHNRRTSPPRPRHLN